MTQAHARLYGVEFKEALEKRSPRAPRPSNPWSTPSHS